MRTRLLSANTAAIVTNKPRRGAARRHAAALHLRETRSAVTSDIRPRFLDLLCPRRDRHARLETQWLRLIAVAFACAVVLGGMCRHAIAREQPVTISGVVTKVRDGDTLQLLTDAGARIEVRLNAIDAPEKAHGSVRGQPYAERSRLNLAQLAVRRRATLRHTTMDRYGRHVGVLTLDTDRGEIDAGWWQVQSGYAWAYERYLNELPARLRVRYREAQAQARGERRGLWADPRAVAPWEWRKRQAPP